jgi:hypothetical protein
MTLRVVVDRTMTHSAIPIAIATSHTRRHQHRHHHHHYTYYHFGAQCRCRIDCNAIDRPNALKSSRPTLLLLLLLMGCNQPTSERTNEPTNERFAMQ